MKSNIINRNLINLLGFLLGASFFFLNLGISILYIYSFFLLLYSWYIGLIRVNFIQKIFLIFIFYLIISNLIINNININSSFILKNIFYLKFFLLFIVIEIVFKKFDLVKKILFINLIILLFLIIEVFVQRLVGFEILGYPIHAYNRATGPYGEELIIGTLIFYVGFHSFFYFLISKKFKSKVNEFLYFVVFFNSYFFSIYLTGERMNLLMSFMVIFLMFMILKDYRKKILVSFILLCTIIYSTFLLDSHVSKKYKSFEELLMLKNILKLNYVFKKTDNIKYETSLDEHKNTEEKLSFFEIHLSHMIIAIDIWEDNKFFGTGLNSFRKICGDYNNYKNFLKQKSCTTHPHNYFLEIVAETGLIGLSFILIIIFLVIKKNLKNILKCLKRPEYNLILISFLIITFSLLWPFKTTGRVFSNFYGTIFWFNFFTCCVLLSNLKSKIHD